MRGPRRVLYNGFMTKTSTSTEPALWNPEKAAILGLGVVFVIGFTVIVGLSGCLKDGPKAFHQIWTDVNVSRNDDFGSIWAFNLLPGSNTVIEVSHTSGVRPSNSTLHASFDTLLIALPDKSCLTVGAKYELDSTDNRVQYSEFTGWYAVCIDTNATAKAIVTVLSATKKAVTLRIECLIPCLWYHPLHDMDGETVTYEKTVDVTARFNIVDTHKKNKAKPPIVTYIAQEPDTND